MQQRPPYDYVHSPMRQWGLEIGEFWLVEKRRDQENGGDNDQGRTQHLHDSAFSQFAISKVCSQSEVQQPRQQDKNVTRAIKQAWTISHAFEMIEVAVHVLAGEQKNDDNEKSKN